MSVLSKELADQIKVVDYTEPRAVAFCQHQDARHAVNYLKKCSGAHKRGIEFNLPLRSYLNIMRAKRCYYTGITLTEPVKDAIPLPTDRTIERVDSKKGYVQGNVVACCDAANNLKSMLERRGSPLTNKNVLRMFIKLNK
jgi:hypothetical protein